MKRYNTVVGGVYDNSVMIDERDGDWVWYEDLEALETKCAELVEAAKPLVERWDTPMWKWDQHTGTLIHRLRDAIAKAEGGSSHE